MACLPDSNYRMFCSAIVLHNTLVYYSYYQISVTHRVLPITNCHTHRHKQGRGRGGGPRHADRGGDRGPGLGRHQGGSGAGRPRWDHRIVTYRKACWVKANGWWSHKVRRGASGRSGPQWSGITSGVASWTWISRSL